MAPATTGRGPGCSGTTKGEFGASVAYAVLDTNIPIYPFAPPPSVHGTEHALVFSLRRSWWSLVKSGSPSILSRTLCSKKSSFKSEFVMLGVTVGGYSYSKVRKHEYCLGIRTIRSFVNVGDGIITKLCY